MSRSLLPPSSAARRVACPGSRALEAQFPDEDSAYATEGHAAHWVASEVLKQRLSLSRLENLPDFISGCLGSSTPQGGIVTKEMVDGALLYSDEIIRAIKPFYLTHVHIEEKLKISAIHSECSGTPDAWAYVRTTGTLHIFDYKFGHGFVEAFENWQLLEYAAGILEILEDVPVDGSPTKIAITIVQPRSFHRDGPIRTWEVSRENIEKYFKILRQAEVAAMSQDAPCVPNPECSYCRGRHACQALQRSVLPTVDLTSSNTPHELSSTQVGTELRFLKRAADRLDARITGLEAQALAEIKSGKRVPFFKVEESSGRERWTLPSGAIAAMGTLVECDLQKPTEVITPKQALQKGFPEGLVKKYSERPRGSLKLVEDDLSETRKIFQTEDKKVILINGKPTEISVREEK